MTQIELLIKQKQVSVYKPNEDSVGFPSVAKNPDV